MLAVQLDLTRLALKRCSGKLGAFVSTRCGVCARIEFTLMGYVTYSSFRLSYHKHNSLEGSLCCLLMIIIPISARRTGYTLLVPVPLLFQTQTLQTCEVHETTVDLMIEKIVLQQDKQISEEMLLFFFFYRSWLLK